MECNQGTPESRSAPTDGGEVSAPCMARGGAEAGAWTQLKLRGAVLGNTSKYVGVDSAGSVRKLGPTKLPRK